MKWLVFVVALGICASVSLPAGASAAVPCRNQVFNDWEHDGQIASTYPLSCYRDALRHVPTTDKIYTSLEDDIRAALQAATARQRGEKVAPEIGHKFTTTLTATGPVSVDQRPMHDEQVDPSTPGGGGPKASGPLAATSSSGGGVPVPLLVLGGVALVLVASGGVGMAVRRRRS
jgi:hypothetical protein